MLFVLTLLAAQRISHKAVNPSVLIDDRWNHCQQEPTTCQFLAETGSAMNLYDISCFSYLHWPSHRCVVRQHRQDAERAHSVLAVIIVASERLGHRHVPSARQCSARS